jgi:hypothetical protein
LKFSKEMMSFVCRSPGRTGWVKLKKGGDEWIEIE